MLAERSQSKPFLWDWRDTGLATQVREDGSTRHESIFGLMGIEFGMTLQGLMDDRGGTP
jgi:hypothetical protein